MPTDASMKKWLARKLPEQERLAIWHFYESWSWQHMCDQLTHNNALAPASSSDALGATPWQTRLSQPRVKSPRGAALGERVHLVQEQQQAPPPPAPTPAAPAQAPHQLPTGATPQQQQQPAFMTAPLAQAPQQHFNATKQEHRGNYGPTRGQGQGPQQGGQRGQGGRGGPATPPNNQGAAANPYAPQWDTQGVQIGPCPDCHKAHRGRCWRCRDCDYVTNCTCPLPRVCTHCGYVTHKSEFCRARQPYKGANGPGYANGQRGAPPQGAAAQITPVPFPLNVQVSGATGLPPAEVARINLRLAAVAAEEIRMGANPSPAARATGVPDPPAGQAWAAHMGPAAGASASSSASTAEAVAKQEPPPGYSRPQQ
eukprot:GHVU01202740.1.p1 GENE.GHVU01202740.1~~GHVU01202740.1.p1  ORF type:complete len:426 (+),score=64.72 GHVU01202740.1:173-1279(+)